MKINKNLKFVFFSMIVLVFCSNLYSQAFNNLQQEDVYKILADNGKKIENIKFNFKQEILNVGNSAQEGVKSVSGNIGYKSPNKFKVFYKNPDIKYFYNGNKLVIFDKQKNQVLINKKGVNEDKDFFGKEIIDFFKFDEALDAKYKITSYWEEVKFYCFIFTEKATNYKVSIYVDKKNFYPKKIVWDKDYIKFVIYISDINFIAKLEDSDFEIEIKKDMKVFDV
jgi:outer membrane lipoprotein-sorting protein